MGDNALHKKLPIFKQYREFFDNMELLFVALKASNILAEDVKLDVDDSSYFDVTEVGVLSSVRNDGDSEGVVGRLANGE